MDNTIRATGKRKCAIASVIVKPGTGRRIVNGSNLLDYLKSETLMVDAEQPFEAIQKSSEFDIAVKVVGGGLSGQAGAIRLGIARALALMSEDYRKVLRHAGFLTRDSRVVERKKYGQPGARKRFQFSKR